jgi:hypothetical protein
MKIVVLLVSLGYSLWALPDTAQGQTDLGQLIVYANGPYEVWVGTYRSIGPDYWIYYYNIDLQEAYVKLGEGTGTQSFPGGYRYYVIATHSLFQLDAIQLPNGEYISGVNYEEGEYVDWGNVHLPFEFNDPPSSPCDIIGDIIDYRHDDYIYGPPDGLTDDVGHPPGCEGTLKNYEGFVVVESYIDTDEDGLDIERIGIMTECEYVDGSPDGPYPWDFEIDVLVSDPGSLHHIDVTNPLGASVVSETIYQTEPGLWGFDPPKDASLDDLRAKYPEGIYTFEFYDSENTLLKTVYIGYSDLSAPASPVDFTYPSSNGETGVSTDPTFTWTIAESAGDILAPGIDDEETGSQVYYGGLVPMTTLSWSPGLLEPDHDYHLDVTVSKIKDWAGPDNLPTMAVGDDEFTYYLTFDYINTISFTTGGIPPEDAVDIDWIQFKIEKNYTAGTPETEPFDIGALVFGSNLNSVQVTSPTGITEVLEPESDFWKWDREERYATLEELYDEFPPGDYLFEFNKGEESEDSTIISFEPEQQPTGFGNVTYPADGATNVELNPTYEWDSCSGYGDNLFVVVENDEDEYWDTLNIEQISWNPGPLAPEHQFKFEITVQNIGEMPGTTEKGDAFNFINLFQWTNEIVFTTQSSAEPIDEIEEVLAFVDESVDAGTLTGEGPGNSADNRLNALRNKLEEAQGLIEAELYEEACDQLWSIYRKCDGDSHPPDFVTGEAAEDLADMILLMMDELGC